MNIICMLVKVARRQVRQSMMRLAVSHHFLVLQESNYYRGTVQYPVSVLKVVTYFVVSITEARRGLRIQGKKRSFMAPRLENDRPDFRRMSGRHPVWNP